MSPNLRPTLSRAVTALAGVMTLTTPALAENAKASFGTN